MDALLETEEILLKRLAAEAAHRVDLQVLAELLHDTGSLQSKLTSRD